MPRARHTSAGFAPTRRRAHSTPPRCTIKLFSVVLLAAALLAPPLSAAPSAPLTWQPPALAEAVELPDCDAEGAVIIDSPSELALLADPRYRVLCVAPGDYRSAGVQHIEAVSGRPGAPRVLRLLTAPRPPAQAMRAPLSQQALMPPLVFRDVSHWLLDGLAFIDIDAPTGTYPLRFFASSDLLLNRLRVEGNRHGIEFHHRSHDITLQNSLIGDMDMDSARGNDAVCVAFEGRYTDKGQDAESAVVRNVRVLANEIYNCNDGVQLIWNRDAQHQPDFSGTLIAGNDIYIDARRLTDCKGRLDPDGDCACTENAIDLKAGALSPSDPVVIRHNRFYGWRKTDTACNPGARSWGSAISVHFKAAQHIRIEQNLFWDVASGVALTHHAAQIVVADNLFHTVPARGGGNGVAIVSYEDVDAVEITGNRIVGAHKWLSLLSTRTHLSCNVISESGAAMGQLLDDSQAERNSYYGLASPRFTSVDDRFSDSYLDAGDGALCTTVRPLSRARRLCLERAVSSRDSEHACGGGYWQAP